ncbi:hypothetical protein CR513_62241, partial [Mucuna pruriens]
MVSQICKSWGRTLGPIKLSVGHLWKIIIVQQSFKVRRIMDIKYVFHSSQQIDPGKISRVHQPHTMIMDQPKQSNQVNQMSHIFR